MNPQQSTVDKTVNFRKSETKVSLESRNKADIFQTWISD